MCRKTSSGRRRCEGPTWWAPFDAEAKWQKKNNIKIKVGDTWHPLTVPHHDADHALVDISCPHCRAAAPIKVAGAKRRIASDDRAYEADGGCLACSTYLGLIRYETNTLFGVREDEAVLLGRCRVY